MKKFNLSKELLLNGVLIGVLSIGLVSCGGGGGSSSSSTPLPSSMATYLYAGTDHPNEPIITVYIDGQPVKLLADTGSSGLVVNSSAVNIPSSAMYSSHTIVTPSGSIIRAMASATVCLNPNITNSCVVMPIDLFTSTSGSPSSTTMEAQGYFGLASGYHYSSLFSITVFSYPYYLEKQYGINSYTISFYPLSNGYYSDLSSTTPIGQISFGVYNGNSNTLISYTVNPVGYPSTTVIFPSSTSSTPSFTGHAVFVSGISYNILTTEVLQTEIPNFSRSSYENACFSYTNYIYPFDIVNGGYSITYSLQNYSGSFQTESFTTEPSSSFCQAGIPFNLMEGITVGYGPGYIEIFGLPAMLGHTFTWVLSTSGSNQGLVQGISINP